MRTAFYGVGAVVIAIIVRSAYKLAQIALRRDPMLWGIFAVMAVTTAWREEEIVTLFLAGGVIAVLWRAPPKLLTQTSGLFSLASPLLLLQIFLFFAQSGAFVFGSGLAIVPFLYGGVVQHQQWLNDHQFLDAVAVAMLTPGPVVITVAFIGYLLAGFLGATAAAVGIFLPVYLFVVIPFRWFDRISGNIRVKAFVDGVTAAAAGAMAGACIVLARRAIVDWPTIAIAVIALALIWRFKIPEPVMIVAGGAVGLLLLGVG